MAGKKERLGAFDRFAEVSSGIVSRAAFFIGCVVLVAVWAPSYFIFRNLNTWQLIINTATTIVTFLLVALLQNSQRRFDLAVQEKLDVIVDSLADLLDKDADEAKDVSELRDARGAENRKSA
jgi:low affinity Fe/Cu permease